MEEEKFWSIIQITKDNSKDDFELQQKELANQLRKLTPDEIILFGNRFRSYRGLANTWELWGAIYIIHGGCGDDSFNDFREWVIGQGKEFYNKTIEKDYKIKSPDSGIIEVRNGDKITFEIKNISKSDQFYYLNKRNQPVKITNGRERKGGLEFLITFDNTIGEYITFFVDTNSIAAFKIVSK